MVAADNVVARLLQVDAEQAVVDDIVLDDVEVAAHLNAGVDVVMGIAGIGQAQVLEGGPVGLEQDDGALAPAIDDHLVAAIKRERLGDDQGAGVGARFRGQGVTGLGRIHQGLQRGRARLGKQAGEAKDQRARQD